MNKYVEKRIIPIQKTVPLFPILLFSSPFKYLFTYYLNSHSESFLFSFLFSSICKENRLLGAGGVRFRVICVGDTTF